MLQPVDTGYGVNDQSALVTIRIESSVCEDFNRLIDYCFYNALDLPAGRSVSAYDLTTDELPITGTSYWIRITTRNDLGGGSYGCTKMQDFMVVPIIVSPASFPVWVAACNGETQVWTNNVFAQTLELKIWGLPSGDDDLRCTMVFEDDSTNSFVARRLGAALNRVSTCASIRGTW